MRKLGRQYALNDLAVYYSGPRSSPRPRRVGGLNPFGFALWLGPDGMVGVFTLKTLLVVGRIRVHALRLRGLRSAKHRTELVGTPSRGTESTTRYAMRCLRLLVLGVPLPQVGQRLKLTKDDVERGVPAGTFGLIERKR